MKSGVIVIFCVVLVLCLSGMVFAVREVRIDPQEELTLDFSGARIRVETWNGDFVKIDTTYLVKEEYELEIDNNLIFFDKDRHLQKYPDDLDSNAIPFIINEVYFIIKIPVSTAVSIVADSANIKNWCQLKLITARNARVRDCVFLTGFTGKGEKLYIKNSRFEGEKDLEFEHIYEENYGNKRSKDSFWKFIFELI